MPNTAEVLASAQARRRAGQLGEAEQLYRQALALEPENAGAHHGLGQALAEQDKLDEAIASFEQAVRLNPSDGEFAYNLQNTCAARDTRQGMMLADQGRLDEAAACYRRALAAQPNYVPAHGNLGNLLGMQGRLDEAAACFGRVIELQPGMAQAHFTLGAIAEQQARPEEAIAHYRRALELAPGPAMMHVRLAKLLARHDQLDEAAASFQRAIELAPELVEAHHGLGGVLAHQVRLTESAACFLRAVELEPDSAEAHHNLGVVLARSGNLEEAIAVHRRTIALRSDHAQAHMALAGSLLILGRLAEGWQEYEWRVRVQTTAPAPVQWKLWQGEPLAGRTIVLEAEQAIGDVLQFIRFAPQLKHQGARVIVRSSALLHPILVRTPGVDRWITPQDESVVADFCIPMMSMPQRMHTTLDNIPANVPYIFAEPRLVESWRQRLQEFAGLRIGIVWQGNKLGGRGRSLPLAQFASLARMPGVQLANLQKGDGLEQLPAFAREHSILDFGDEVDTSTGAFMDTAAIMKNLDLVITADTAAAHLAGALGVDVWVALQRVPEWRWLLERDDSPWYPTMRLFRQTHPGDWTEVFRRIEQAVRERMKSEG